MKRTMYGSDHDDFRSMVREFLTRDVEPNMSSYIGQKRLPREFWTAAAKPGLLGLEVPEEYGGAGPPCRTSTFSRVGTISQASSKGWRPASGLDDVAYEA